MKRIKMLGYHYTARYTGVLWASGWLRARTKSDAVDVAIAAARAAQGKGMP